MAKAKFFDAYILASTTKMTEEEWLIHRMQGIGGSDVGAIAGVSEYGSPLSIYLSKTAPDFKKSVGRSAQWGKWMEDPIARDSAKRNGWQSRKVNAILQHKEEPWMLANIDRLIFKPFIAIHEIKMIVNRERCNKIRKSVEDGKPVPLPEHEAQVRWYMAVTGIDKAYITYEMAYGEPIDILVERDMEIERNLIEMAARFWTMVLDETPPAMDGSTEADNFLQAMFNNSLPNSVDLGSEADFLIESYKRAKEIIDQQEQIMGMARQNLERMLGENQTGRTRQYIVSWKPQDMGRFDSTQFKKDHPGMYDVYKKSNIRRVFRVT